MATGGTISFVNVDGTWYALHVFTESGEFVTASAISAGSTATIGDYDVGTVGSGAAVEIDNADLVTGALVSLVSFTQTEG